jgi:hypothetical protein
MRGFFLQKFCAKAFCTCILGLQLFLSQLYWLKFAHKMLVKLITAGSEVHNIRQQLVMDVQTSCFAGILPAVLLSRIHQDHHAMGRQQHHHDLHGANLINHHLG